MPCKKVVLTIFLATVLSICYCQDKTDSVFFAEMPVKYITLIGDSSHIKGFLPFSGVKIMDERFDTTIIGYTLKHLVNPARKIKFKESSSKEMERYVTGQYSFTAQGDSSLQLIIVLEKLWLSSSFETGRKQRGETPVVDEGIFGSNTQSNEGIVNNKVIMLSAKLLGYTNGNYYYIHAIDSIYLMKGLEIGHNENDVIKFGIDEILSRLVNRQISDIKISRRPIPAESLNQFAAAKFDIPILKTTYYRKGVFKTFEEFKNNNPSILTFDISRTDKTDALYVTEANGPSYLLRDFWGYGDGTNIYINKGDNFFRLFKRNNTFVFLGFNTLSKIYYTRWGNMLLGSLLYGAPAGGTVGIKYKGQKTPLQVDMETGDCY